MKSDAALVLLVLLVLAGGGRRARKPPWTDEDMRVFVRELGATGMRPLDALLVFTVESGLNPAAQPPSGAAAGINQAQLPLLQTAGWLDGLRAFAALDVAEQIPWVAKMVRRQIAGIGYVPSSAVEFFRANLSPLAARERREIIYRRDNPSEAAFYAGNKGLDAEGKGWIDMTDLARVLDRVKAGALFQRHAEQLGRVSREAA